MCKEVDNNSNEKLQNNNIISTNAKEMINMSPALAYDFKESTTLKKRFNIEEIKLKLGLDNCKAINLTNSDTKDFERDSNYFKDWYEEELRNLYDK